MSSLFKTIAKHSAIYGIGDLLSKAVGFLLIPLYTNYLSSEQYGILELLGLISFIVSLFFGAGISQSITRFYYQFKDEPSRDHVVGNALACVWFIGTLALLLLCPISINISTLVFETGRYSSFLSLVFFSTVIQLSNEVGLTVLRVRERSGLFTVLNLARLIVTLILNIYFVAWAQIGVLGILFSTLVSSTLLCAVLLIYCVRTVSGELNIAVLKEMLAYGMPLILGGIAMLSLHFADRFILQRYGTLSDVGIYALAYKFGMLPNFFIVTPFMRYWGVKQYDLGNQAETRSTISRVFTYFCLINSFVGLGIAVIVGDVIRLIADESFHPAASYAPLLVSAYLIAGSYHILSFGMLYSKKTRLVAIANGIAALSNIALNLLLIPSFGVLGACITTFISFSILVATTYFFSQTQFKIHYERGRIAKLIICFLCLLSSAILLDTGSLWINMILRTCIALSYPLALHLLQFFTESELKQIMIYVSKLKVKLQTLTS
jgi:O-antigen/teichoic acid export membrane protein